MYTTLPLLIGYWVQGDPNPDFANPALMVRTRGS